MYFFKKREDKAERNRRAELSALCESMKELERELIQNEALFNLTTDSDLMDSLIFERNAKAARLSYLLKRAKELQKEPA